MHKSDAQPASKLEYDLSPNGHAYLDLVRALAAWGVLFQHASGIFDWQHKWPTGGFGVVLFFLLSGFLIFQSGWRRMRKPAPHYLPFMIDRFARIFTVYVPVLVFVVIANLVFNLSNSAQDGVATGPWAFFGNLFLLQDYPFFQAAANMVGNHNFHIRSYNSAEPFWTIPIEFWIYVWFGAVFFCGFMRERISKILLLAALCVSTPVIVWNIAGGGGKGLGLDWFIGATMAYIWVTSWARASRNPWLGGLVLLLGVVLLLGRIGKIGLDNYDHGIVICMAMIVFGGLSLLEGLPPLPVFIRKICAALAAYSYSLYLVHNTVLMIFHDTGAGIPTAKISIMAIISAHLVAIMFYFLFEQHYRRVGKAITRRLLGPKAGA